MPVINHLDQETINKIAAGEVVERPAAVVKELVENAIDAKASAVTVEIKEGGLSLIRITDNGCGMDREEIPKAFLRHCTSKITSIEDLSKAMTLGFRGEALSSVAAVAQVELLTCTAGSITGSRYEIDGGVEKSIEDAGCPKGTTILVRNLFYNAPVRKKFLKSNVTEGTYINNIMERFAVSHPETAFTFIMNNQRKLVTSGNGNQKDVIYQVYGRDITANLIEINSEDTKLGTMLRGYIGKPSIVRGNRSLMNYFVNGRYIKSSIINSALERAYASYVMGRKYPFCVLSLSMDTGRVDVNVHPTKMEVRFDENEKIYDFIYNAVNHALKDRELIQSVSLNTAKEEMREKKEKETVKKEEVKMRPVFEPFEVQYKKSLEERPLSEKLPVMRETVVACEPVEAEKRDKPYNEEKPEKRQEAHNREKPVQLDYMDTPLLSKEAKKKHRIVGQVFGTYWVVEFEDKMFLIDQHAAHEKVIYEKKLKDFNNKDRLSQAVTPMVITFNMQEQEVLVNYRELLYELGFEIEHFGGNEYVIRGVPADLTGLDEKEVFIEIIDSLMEEGRRADSETVLSRLASISCKAAVKGNHKLSFIEAQSLIDQLMELENPYNCPHGRPTIISMDKYEIERKFKRIV